MCYLNPVRIALIIILCFPVLSSASEKVSRTEFWYEDNNLGSAGGVPDDFFVRYDKPETWARSRKTMDVFYLRTNTYEKYVRDNPAFMKKMAGVHRAGGIRLALDSTAATWAHFKNGYETPNYEHAIERIRRFKACGLVVSEIGLQSVLSKPTRTRQDYAMEWRIKDIVEFFKQVGPVFPEMKIGLIDAMPSKDLDHESAYLGLKLALADEGYSLAFIHLDMPMSHPRDRLRNNSWAKMVGVGRFVQKRIGCKFGLICTDNVGGRKSGESFRSYVLDGLKQYLDHGGRADHYILMSWYEHPEASIPDDISLSPGKSPTQLGVFREMVSAIKAKADAK